MKRHSAKGLTLVELLVVLAIVGLLIAVLLVFLMPSDDRRCELEAQRLAAFLNGAAAEAVAHDGPTRAAFVFGAQTATREISETRAETVGLSFAIDKRGDVFETKRPVRFTSLITELGEVATGEGWIVFNGARTRGAVVLVGLNEAVWSVVVPPGGLDSAYAKRGKVRLPAALKGRPRGLPPGPGLALNSLPGFGQGGGLGALPNVPAALDPLKPLPAVSNQLGDNTNTADDDVVPGGLGDEPFPDEINPPNSGVEDPNPSEEPEDDPEEEPEEEPECRVGAAPFCRQYYQCVPAGEDGSGVCQLDLSGVAVRAGAGFVQRPAQAASMMSPIFNDAIAQQQFNLIAKFWAPVQGGARYNAGIAQAVRSGSGYLASPELPSYTQVAVDKGSCTSGFTHCYEFNTENMVFYVANTEATAGTCGYFTLMVRATVRVLLNLPKDQPNVTDAQIELTGIITDTAARKLRLPSDDVPTLKALFDQLGVSWDVACRSAEYNDAYSFAMTGQGQFVDLFVDQLDSSRRPANCNPIEQGDFCID